MTTYAATVTRTELGLATLNIHDGSVYYVEAFDPGEVDWRREEAKSPLASGVIEIGSILDDAKATLLVQVRGATHAAIQSSISTLVSAFKQTSYTLTVTVDGTSYAWTCRRAKYGARDGFDFVYRARKIARVQLTFPRSPIPSAGPL